MSSQSWRQWRENSFHEVLLLQYHFCFCGSVQPPTLPVSTSSAADAPFRAKFPFCFCWKLLCPSMLHKSADSHQQILRFNAQLCSIFCSIITLRTKVNEPKASTSNPVHWQKAHCWTMCSCVTYLHAMAQAVQLLVVDWSTAIRWAGLCTGRRLRRREDLVAAWDSSHCREDADFSPRNFLFVHLHRLKRWGSNLRPVSHALMTDD